MPSNDDILAEIYHEIGMGHFAAQMTSRLLDHAQRNDWMGRQIAVLGSKGGESLQWLAQHSYVVTGVEPSGQMMKVAQQALRQAGVSAQFMQHDYRKVQLAPQDMVLALDTLSELGNIRELERTFKHIHTLVRDGKLFIFDIYTIEGLVTRNQDGYMLEHDADGLTIFVGNTIDYERSIQYRNYIIFRAVDGSWQRQEAERRLRAYPIQGVTALVKRSGFDVQAVLRDDMREYSLGDATRRVIVVARKK